MVARWFPWVIYVLIAGTCAMLIIQEIKQAYWSVAKWLHLLGHQPMRAFSSLWREFWNSWLAVGTAAGLMYTMAFVPDLVSFGLAKTFFVIANLLFFVRLCIEERLHGPKENRKQKGERLTITFLLLVLFSFLSFVECGMITNRERGLPATVHNIWAASPWWREPRQQVAPATSEHKAQSEGASTPPPVPPTPMDNKHPQKLRVSIVQPGKNVDPLIPPVHKTDSFITYVMFSDSSKNNPVLCPSGQSVRISTCAEFAEIAKTAIPDENSLVRNGRSALQHFLVALVQSAADGWGSMGPTLGGGKLTETRIPPIDVPDREIYKLDPATTLTNADRAFFPYLFNLRPELKLPRGSMVSFVHLPPGSEYPESYVLRLERRGYYALDLAVSSYHKNEKGLTPENYQMKYIDISQITTYDYQVRLDMTVQRTNEPTFVVGDYEEWGRALFANIREKLEH